MLKITNLINRPVGVAPGIVIPVNGSKSYDIPKTERIKDLIRAKIISVQYVESPQQIISRQRAQQPAPTIINKKSAKPQEEKKEETKILNSDNPEDKTNIKKES